MAATRSGKLKDSAPLDWQAALDVARQTLVVRRKLGDGDVGRLGVPKALRAKLLDDLVGPGVERTRNGVRLALVDQLRAALAERGSVPIAALGKLATGGTVAEVKAAARRLVEEGRVAVVVRGKTEVLMPVSEAIFSRDRLVALERAVQALAGQCKKALAARGGPRTLLAVDVQALLLDLVTGSDGGSPVERGAPRAIPENRVIELVRQHTRPGMGLAFVCDVVRALLPSASLGAIHDALLAAARARRIELRPESGVGRLSDLEAWLCPPGPAETRLSWARVLEGGGW